MKSAMLAIDWKLSASRSSTDVVTPNSCSSWTSSSTNASESSTPASNKLVSNDGASIFSAPEITPAIRSRSRLMSDISYLLVFGRDHIEPEPVVGFAVDDVTGALPAKRFEVDVTGDLDRRVGVDDPRMNRSKAELLEAQRQHLRRRQARVALPAVRLVAEDDPEVGGLEMLIDVGKANHADRRAIVIGREQSQHVGAALHPDLEPLRADQLTAIAEVEPLKVFLSSEPARDELNQLGRIKRFELHERLSLRSDP